MVVPRAIDSVLAQRHPADEIIVVDDGSSDETDEVAARYDGQVTFVKQENRGVSAARNAGVARSRSDFVAFLDSDDIWFDDHLVRILLAIERTAGEAGLYFSDLEFAASRRGSSAWGWSNFSIESDYELRPDGRPWAFLSIQPMTIPASVVRHDVYTAVGGCSEDLACREDTHLFFKLAVATPFCAVAGSAGLAAGGADHSLTRSFTPGHPTYVDCTVSLYSNLLESPDAHFFGEQRRILARRLADAHWARARECGTARPLQTLRHLGRGTRQDPFLIPRRISRKMASITERPRTGTA